VTKTVTRRGTTRTPAKRAKRAKSLGQHLIDALDEAIAFERGELEIPASRVRRVAVTAREAEGVPAPRYAGSRIAALRGRLGLSQPVFAQALNVSAETVRAWEQGKRTPDGAALRLLQLAEEHPAWLTKHVTPVTTRTRATRVTRATRATRVTRENFEAALLASAAQAAAIARGDAAPARADTLERTERDTAVARSRRSRR